MKNYENVKITYKPCKKCEVKKPLFCFNKNAHSKDGLNHVCADCIKKHKKDTELERLRKVIPSLNKRSW